MTLPIIDGTGKGYKAKVDSDNRLSTLAITESTFDSAVSTGKSFNINTQFISITGSGEIPILSVTNNTSNDVALVNFFIGTGVAAGTPTEQGLIRAYFNATGLSGGDDVEVINRNSASQLTFALTAKKHSASSAITATLSSTPVLYQTQGTSSRVFGNVYLFLGVGKNIVVTYQPNGAETINIYTGFSGYIED